MLQVISISIPDELYETFVKQNPQNPSKAIVRHLDKFKSYSFADRAIMLTGEDLAEVQRAAGRTVETPKEVVSLVREALSIKVEGMGVELSEGQRSRLKQMAAFFNQSPEAYGAAQVKEALTAKLGA